MTMMRELALEERPREKLLDKGAAALTDVELLAILLRSGRQGMSVLEMARDVYEELFNQDMNGRDWSWKDLTAVSGIGPSKAATLVAALELGRRISSQHKKLVLEDFSSPDLIYAYFFPKIGHLDYEVLHGCFLNRQNRLIRSVELSSGGWDSSTVDVRRIMSEALRWGARSMVLVHNHPSGRSKPSRADVLVTEKIGDAAALLDILLLDHVVIGDGEFTSLRREGLYRS